MDAIRNKRLWGISSELDSDVVLPGFELQSVQDVYILELVPGYTILKAGTAFDNAFDRNNWCMAYAEGFLQMLIYCAVEREKRGCKTTLFIETVTDSAPPTCLVAVRVLSPGAE